MKMMRTAAAGPVLALCMVLSAGCGEKEPAPEELLANAFPQGKMMSAQMGMEVSAGIDMAAMMGGWSGGDGGVSDESAAPAMMLTMDVSVDAQLEQSGNVSHMSGRTKASMFGMETDEAMDEWQERHQDGTVDKYSYSPDMDMWTVSHDAGDAGSENDLFGMDYSQLTGIALEDPGKKSGIWAVTGQMPMDAMSGVAGGTEGLGLEDMAEGLPSVSFRAEFDRGTHEIRSIVMSMDAYSAEGIDITKFNVSVTGIAFGDGAIEVPAEVKAASVEEVGAEWGAGEEEAADSAAWCYGVDLSKDGFAGAVQSLDGSCEMQAFTVHDSLSGATRLYLMCLNRSQGPVGAYLGWNGMVPGDREASSDYSYCYTHAGKYDVAEFVFYPGECPETVDAYIEAFEPWEELVSDGIEVSGAWSREDTEITGIVANHSGTAIGWVRARAVFFGPEGNIVYMATDYADPSQIEDGGESTFHIWTGDMPAGYGDMDLTVSVYVLADPM